MLAAIWIAAILYYVTGCFAFCYATELGGDDVDGFIITLAITLGWVFLPITLLIIGLLKVFK